MSKRVKINFIINTIFYSIIAIMVYFAARFLLAYLFPVIIGTGITIMVQRPARVISNKTKIKQGYCALILVILAYMSIVALLGFGIYKGSIYLADFLGAENGILSTFSDASNSIISEVNGWFDGLPTTIQNLTSKITNGFVNGVSNYISDFAKNTAKSFPMFITSSLVTIVASCYIARDFYGFKASVKSILSDNTIKAFRMTADLFKSNVSKILIGYIKLLFITFIELFLGFVLLKIDYALLFAIVIALLDLLPIIGTGTVLIPWGIFEIVSNNNYLGIGLLILYAISTIIRNVIEPKIIGKQMGLHPLIALIAVFIGLKLLGFIGIFILPFTIMFIYKMYENGIFQVLFSKRKNSGS